MKFNPLALLLSSVLLLSPDLQAQTWQKLTTGTPHDGSAAISIGAGNGNTLYAGYGNNKGVFRSENNGVSWTAVNSGLADGASAILSPKGFLRTSTGRIIRSGDTASWNNGVGSPVWYSDNNGSSWTQATFPFNTPSKNIAGTIVGFGGMVEHDGAIFASEVLSHGVWKSTDNGATWTASSTGIPSVPFFAMQLAYNVATDGTALYAATPNWGVWRSTDNGVSWQIDNTGIPGIYEALFSSYTWVSEDIKVTADGTVFAIVENAVWRRDAAQNRWEKISTGAITTDPRRLAVHGNDVYVSTSGPLIFTTADKGVTWRGIVATGLPSGSSDILNDSFYAHNGALYYAASDGLYRTDLSTATYVNITPVIIQAPKGGGVNQGDSFIFTVKAAGTGPFTYVWKRGSTVVGTDPTYTINSAVSGDAGDYTVVVTGPGGPSEESAPVTLYFAPKAPAAVDFTYQPGQASGFLGLGYVRSVSQAPDGSVFVGGTFGTFQGFDRIRLAKTDYSGSVDLNFVTGSGLFSGTGPTEEVFALVPMPNGDVLVGGGDDNGGEFFWRRYKANGTVDFSYPWPIEINNSVYKAKLLPNGKILVAGRISSGIVRLNADGRTDQAWQQLAGFSGGVRDFVVQADGKIIVVGDFTGVGPRIVRLNANGSLDSSFTPGTGAVGALYAVALQPDGKIIIAGDLTTYNGTSRTRIARLESNGTLDTSFNPGTGPNARVREIAVTAAGHIYIGGEFTMYGATSQAYFARVTSAGALDATFPNPQFSGKVYSIEVQADGHLMVGGDFATVGGVPVGHLVRLLGVQQNLAIVGQPLNQQVDQGNNATFKVAATGIPNVTYQWRKNGTPLSNTGKFSGVNTPTLLLTGVTVADEDIYDVVVSNGTVSLTSATVQLFVNNAPVISIHPVGGQAPRGNAFTFTVSARGKGALTYQWYKGTSPLPNSNSASYTISPVSATDAGAYSVVITSSLGTATSSTANITVVERPGLRENIFNVVGGPNAAPLSDVEISPDGKVYIAGPFDQWNGDNLRDTIVRLNGNGTLDTSFTIGNVGDYREIAVLPDGKLIVAGGSGIKRITTSGGVDGSFNASTAPNDTVHHVLILPDGKIIVAGEFTSLAGQTRPGIVRLNADGSLDNTFYVAAGFVNGGLTGEVYAVVVQPDGKLIVGGAFNKYQGVTVPPLVRLNINGTLDTTFVAPTINQPVTSLALQPDGKIIAGGSFTLVGNQTRKYLARFTADGNVDTGFVIESQFNNVIQDVLLLPSGKIVVGGTFTSFAGILADGIMRLNADGTPDSAFQANTGLGARLNTEVTALKLLPDGKIVIVGGFYDFDQNPSLYTAKLLSEQTPLAFTQVPSSTVPSLGSTLTLHAKATGTSNVSYQWYKGISALSDSGNISGSQTATLVITGVTAGNAGDYYVVITNLSGSQPSPIINISPITAPVILSNPAATNVVATQTISLNTTALGTGTLTYQWYRDTTLINDDGGRITGATTPSLTIANAVTGDSGYYKVVVTDSLGSSTSLTALVSVIIQPGSVNNAWTAINFNNSLDHILILPDGRLAVSGPISTANSATRRQIAILSAAGALDTTFTPTATSPLTDLGAIGQAGAHRMAVLPDGRIVMAVYANSGSGNVGGVFIFEANGTYTFAGQYRAGYFGDILAEPDGSFIVVGGYNAPQGGTGIIEKRRYNGSNWVVDSTFAAPIPNAGVTRIIRLSNGQYLIGGSFTMIAGQSRPMVARLNADGSLDQSFAISSASGPSIIALAEESSGSYLMLGGFSSLPGIGTSYGLARVSNTGTVDTTFNPNLGTANIIQNYQGRDLKLQTDGKILVFGRGTVGIARLNIDGTLDASFNPGGGIASASFYIYAGALAPNGDLYIVGDFNNYNSAVPSKVRIAKINNDPVHLAFTKHPTAVTIDQAQDAQFKVEAFGSSTISYQWLKNGQVLADGGRISGATTATLNITGALPADDAQYSVRISNLAGQTVSKVVQLTVLGAPVIQVDLISSTNVYAGSNVVFAPKIKAASTSTYTWRKNGDVVANGGRITGATTSSLTISNVLASDAGSYQLTIANGLGSATTASITMTVTVLAQARDASFRLPSGANNYVRELALLPDGGAFVAGDFTAIAGLNNSYFVRLDANGANVAVATLAKFNAPVTGMWLLPSGKYLVSGTFTSVNNNTAYQRLVRLEADGSLDTTFQCPLNSSINTAVGMADGTIIIGGGFSATYNTVNYQYLARLSATGIPDSTFLPKVNNTVNSVAVQSDGKLVVGGGFSAVVIGTTPNSAYYYLARFNANGTHDTAYKPEPNSQVSRFQLLANDQLFVIGQFQAFGPGGNQVSRKFMGKLNSNGSVDTSFVPPTQINSAPTSFAVQANGKVLISGGFTVVVTGQNHYQFARLNADGSLDSAFETGTEMYYNNNNLNYALTIKLASDGLIWLGGQFNAYDGTVVAFLTRLNGESPTTYVDPHPLYTEWAADKNLTPGVNNGLDDDADGDGYSNIVEYVFGTHPNLAVETPLFNKVIVSASGTDYAGLRLQVRKDLQDIEVIVTASEVVTFTTSIPTIITALDQGEMEQVTIRSTVPMNTMAQVFFRIVIRDTVIEQ